MKKDAEKNITAPPEKPKESFRDIVLIYQLELGIEIYESIKERRREREHSSESYPDSDIGYVLIITSILITCLMYNMLLLIIICSYLFG